MTDTANTQETTMTTDHAHTTETMKRNFGGWECTIPGCGHYLAEDTQAEYDMLVASR